MATERIRKGSKPYLFIDEWIERLGLDNQRIADRMGRARETVWRWRKDKRKLTPDKQAELAHALGIEPEDLWRHPDRPSADALLKDQPKELQQTAVDIVRRLIGQAS